jgi:hypothetical protein
VRKPNASANVLRRFIIKLLAKRLAVSGANLVADRKAAQPIEDVLSNYSSSARWSKGFSTTSIMMDTIFEELFREKRDLSHFVVADSRQLRANAQWLCLPRNQPAVPAGKSA